MTRKAGFKHSEETRRKMSETAKRQIVNGEREIPHNSNPAGTKGFLGHKHSEYTKEKISKVLKERGIKPTVRYSGPQWNKGLTMNDPRVAKSVRAAADANMGREMPQWHKDIMSRTNAGKRLSDVHKCKISTSKRGICTTVHTPELIDKISAGNAKATVDGKHKFGIYYSGIVMQCKNEAYFARWCDDNNIKWKYQPLFFKVRDGVRYVPDFMLLDSGEFVEIENKVSYELRDLKIEKLNAFVDAGNILYYINTNESCKISEEKMWRNSSRRSGKNG